MEKLGLSYEDLKQRKPDIIFARGTGWGLNGPMVDRTAQDLIIQARSGLVAATGPGDRSNAVGCAVVDQHGGALLAMGILAAYAKKLTTGKGTHVQGSLLNSGIDLQTEPLTNYMSSRPGSGVFKRQENLVSGLLGPRTIWVRMRDSRHFTIWRCSVACTRFSQASSTRPPSSTPNVSARGRFSICSARG